MERLNVKVFRSVKVKQPKSLTNSGDGGIMKMSKETITNAKLNIGKIIAESDLNKFKESVLGVGIKFFDITSYGGFETYRGDVSILNELVSDLAIIKRDILPKTKLDDFIISYKDLGNDVDFACVSGKTINFNKRIYDDSVFLKQEYEKAVNDGYFVKGTSYRNIPYHEIGHIIFKKNSKYIKYTVEKVSKKAAEDGFDLIEYIKMHISVYAKKDKYYFTELMPELLSGAYSNNKKTRELCKELLGGK